MEDNTPDNTEEEEPAKVKKKRHPGSKGTDRMNDPNFDAKALRREIIAKCREMIGRGYSHEMKVEYLRKHYQVTVRQSHTYIRYCRDDIKARKIDAYTKEYDDIIIKLETLYRDLYAANKLDQALKVINQVIALRGYEVPKQLLIKQEVEVRNDLSHLTEVELLDLQKLLDKGKQ